MRSRRGQLAGLLFPLIALVLVGVSLFTFISFNDRFADSSEGMSNILSSIAFYENYIIKESELIVKDVILSGGLIMTDFGLKSRFQEFAEKRNLGIVGTEDYFDKIKRGDFIFKHDGNKYLFEIKDLNLKADGGANSFSRNLSLMIEFDFNGNILNYSKDL